MGAAKKQRTVEHFQRQGSIEIAKLVKQDVAKLEAKRAEQKKFEEKKSNKENQNEVTDIGG